MLGYLSARWLLERGFLILDYGQTDSNPIMAYKKTVARVVERPTHFQRFCSTNRLHPPPTLPQGVVISPVTPANLYAL